MYLNWADPSGYPRGVHIIEIHVVDSDLNHPSVREIFWEYLQWANERVSQEYGICFEISAILDQDTLDSGKFMPPSGRLLLGMVDHPLAGVAYLEALGEDCGEIKRMYVRPDWRRMGLGRALRERLLAEAARIGYPRIRLDSMKDI